jgi:hypothetical protein
MTNLFQNAVDSLIIGVEDFQQDTPQRSLSAVRNFYSGTLLLVKEVLCRKAPNAPMDLVIAAQYCPQLDGTGDIEIVQKGYTTIDFREVGVRLKAFGIPLEKDDLKRLEELQQLRNNIEHKFTEEPHKVVQELIANVFPVVLKLFYLCHEDAQDSLGEAWQVMVEISDAYKVELAICRTSFENVSFPKEVLSPEHFSCLDCDSKLVVQVDPSNADHHSIECRCKSCGTLMSAEKATEKAIENKYAYEIYSSHGAEEVIGTCPSCALETYAVVEDCCIWCEETLGDCGRCGAGLTPSTVSIDDTSFCDWCGHMMAKAD